MPEKPYTSPVQEVIDTVTPGGVLGRFLLDYASNKLLKPNDSRHPKDARKGSVETLLKYLANKYGTVDRDADAGYLEQYLHPDKPVLAPATEFPQHRRDMPYKKLDARPDNVMYSKLGNALAKTSGLGNFALIGPENNVAYGNDENMRRLLSTPNAKQAPHIFDVWDFDTDYPMVADTKTNERISRTLDPLAKALLKRTGQPYAIYDKNPIYEFFRK